MKTKKPNKFKTKTKFLKKTRKVLTNQKVLNLVNKLSENREEYEQLEKMYDELHKLDPKSSEYEKLYDKFKELGIDEIYCVSVNDVYVMKKWKEYENINKVKLIADGTCSFTRSIGMNVNWIKERGLGERSWRYSAYIENGIVINSFIESPFKDESVEDPFEVSDAETMLSYLKEKLRIEV